jgi:hypothetical protein
VIELKGESVMNNDSNNADNGQTDMPTEIAGQATVDSAPSERSSSDGENGLDANAEGGVHLPGPLFEIDAPVKPGADQPA